MRISTLFVLATLWLAGTAVAAPLEQILKSPHREADSSRDGDHHPAETLAESILVEFLAGIGIP